MDKKCIWEIVKFPLIDVKEQICRDKNKCGKKCPYRIEEDTPQGDAYLDMMADQIYFNNEGFLIDWRAVFEDKITE